MGRGTKHKNEASVMGTSSSQSQGFHLFRSIPRSPNAFSSGDRGQVYIVNRQEEDLIKKIDFKYDCHLYNHDESNSKHVHLNISNLFGDQNFSLNETINTA